MTGYCKECGEVAIHIEDDSFSHEFGTEYGCHAECSECNGEVYEDEDCTREVDVYALIEEMKGEAAIARWEASREEW